MRVVMFRKCEGDPGHGGNVLDFHWFDALARAGGTRGYWNGQEPCLGMYGLP